MASWQKVRGGGFVNPYNFVPLSESDVVRGYNAEDGGGLSGVIECTLRTITPMAMPDLEGLPESQVNGQTHKGEGLLRGVPFFKIPALGGENEGVPAIPGSEIRGVIRSAFEALDNGCLSVNNNNIASSRSSFPLRAAILDVVDGQAELHEASKLGSSGYRTSDAVSRTWPQLKGTRAKTSYYIRTQNSVAVPQEELQRALRDYYHVVDIYKKNAGDSVGFDRTHTVVPDPLPTNGSWVVFYTLLEALPGTEQEDVLYLSPAQITRTVFRKRVSDLLGSHAKCENPDDMCEACALFGMVGKDGQASSRLRFGDAVMIPPEGETYANRILGGMTLKELASPKPSSLEFYTKRPLGESGAVALTWTYDGATYGYAKRGRLYDPQTKRFPPGMPTLVRGRKFYLHHYVSEGQADDVIVAAARTEEKTKRNMTTEIVRSQTDFRFKVYFERLTEGQLAKLVWTLCIGENDLSGKQLHMMGHGKPLGLGSSKIRVDTVYTRSVDAAYRMVRRDVNELLSAATFPDAKVVGDYCTMTDFTLTKGLSVSYPQADDLKGNKNSRASHQWFIANVSLGEGGVGPMAPSAYRALPKLPQTNRSRSMLVLPKFTLSGRGSNSDVSYPFEMSKEETVQTPIPVVRETGTITAIAIKGDGADRSFNGWIRNERFNSLFFHSNFSPSLSLDETPLAKGKKVSFTVGKNTGGRNPNQDVACDLRLE